VTGQAPGVVKVRLSGAAADIEPVAGLLAARGWVLDRSAAYPNRRDPGERVYLTLQVTAPAREARSS
jgi:hypothetical protein